MTAKAAARKAKGNRAEFYRRSMQVLQNANIPFLIAGAGAVRFYTGVSRQTKDFDLHLRPHHIDGALDAFAHAGYKTEKTFPHWLAKAKRGRNCVDLIFRAGNGLCEVDDSWFERAQDEDVLGVTVKLSAPEDMLWMKAYIMERERYDGADVAHILESCAEKLNWPHLLRRFGPDWRLLLSHLVLFGYIYPSERGRVPVAIMDALISRLRNENSVSGSDRLCRGTLLSREQYLWDVEERGFRDARLEKRAHMNEGDIAHWTKAIAKETRRKKRAGEIPHPK
ncbi:MAG: hypothetical protein DMF22_07120 [Verrucomicrobia bacterium]|nr:MAG: hypothetical protein DME83_01770 [Verrucomicrobiota bacterium]PYJ99978.1 MAG: hypothetical protein DME68_02150 [Verrucomicrobiota bacterium]PYL71349.1 MAG: hypothetical protein DMF22_07120 [Verrucomicrobiota bacterium]